jgi:hypothetical protein
LSRQLACGIYRSTILRQVPQALIDLGDITEHRVPSECGESAVELGGEFIGVEILADALHVALHSGERGAESGVQTLQGVADIADALGDTGGNFDRRECNRGNPESLHGNRDRPVIAIRAAVEPPVIAPN